MPGRNKTDAASLAGDAAQQPLPSAAAVAQYLRRNPEFFLDHPDLAAGLQVPHPSKGEGVLDFQAWRGDRLAKDLTALKEEYRDLLETVRSNEQAGERVAQSVLRLLEAPSFEHLIQVITTDMARLLDVDGIVLALEVDPDNPVRFTRPGLEMLAPGTVEQLMGPSQVLLLGGAERPVGLFGPLDPMMSSTALARLNISDTTPPALFALGSRQEDTFTPQMRSDHLVFLARVMEQVFRGWLSLI